MERSKPKTPKRKPRFPLTPDTERKVVDSTTNAHAGRRQRSTMAPCDFALPQSTVKRRLGLDRTSVFSTHGSMDGACTTGSEGNDTELKLLYDQYMQNLLTKEILKRRQQEKMHLFFIQLATIAKECNDLKEKLFKLKIRERDIMNLTKIQAAIDSQIADTNNCTLKEDLQALESTLSQLYSHIKPFDVLRVSNMVLPETTEEWSNMRETMESCSETLKSIIDIIGLRKESYENVSKGVKEFIHIFDDIKEHHQRLEKEIPNLQFLVLKGASLALMEDHN